ncbi:MAG: hypothetical protein MR964_08290 [Campylobacter sp.]|uniref:hypothetical protein n=1 Tax=Campylobacter sp. TaxID=205 RepID=UPI002AA5EE7B|nr:hypothetical protein [Campylobacter sp.]MCI7024198.1 hypothetical protein [Campylobacter sp.]
MQGKILSTQLIIGDDGKHYEYDKNDVVNLDGKDLALLTDSQVDFVSFDERVAKSIYIINENVNVSGILSADRISFARLSALWGLGLEFFSCIPDIGHIGQSIGIVGFVLYSMAIYSVSKAAASKSLFKNYITAVISGFLGVFLFVLAIRLLGSSEHVSIGTSVIAVLLLAMIALIAAIYFYKVHAELARLSGSSLFLWSFWIYTVSVLLYFVFGIFTGFAGFITFAAFAVSIIVLVPLFVAWWRFGKVEKR